MPERIEALTIAEELHEKLKGKSLLKVEWTDKAKQSGLAELKLPLLTEKVFSYGKKVIMRLTEQSSDKKESKDIITSLGMTGMWSYTAQSHAHITLSFGTAGKRLMVSEFQIYYCDPRRFGNVAVYDDSKEVIKELGPDVLEVIESKEWTRIFRASKVGKWQICKALMEQNLIAGVGNYLKSEILYVAGIRPDRLVSELSDVELERVRVKTYDIVQEVRKYSGLTILSYIAPSGTQGKYPRKVYKKEKDPLGNVVVEGKFKDTRTTYYVPELQK